MSKYEKLHEFLIGRALNSSDIAISFKQIEQIIGSALPASARTHRPWWSNQKDSSNRPQAKAWMDAGFKVESVDTSRGNVQFSRFCSSAPHRKSNSSPSTSIHKAAVKRNSKTKIDLGRGAVFLVSCVSRKATRASQAKDLYVSDWFLKARNFVETHDAPWFILSAEYGLLHPERVIRPYEVTLNNMRINDRRQWAEKVITQMEREIPERQSIVVLAGQRYREFLMDYLTQKFEKVAVPLESLRIGEQLRWFTERT